MHVHINHVFCTDSIWGGAYDCRYMVVIKRWEAPRRDDPDWMSLLREHPFFDQAGYERMRDEMRDDPRVSDASLRRMNDRPTYRLRADVMEWLIGNVEDGPGGVRGFAVGTDAYNQNALDGYSLWFHRRSDALKFIKTWSRHAKPTTYFDYFREIRKELDPETGKLRVVDQFTRI